MQPVTASYFIKRGLQLIQVVPEGQEATAQQINDGCYVLNENQDSWTGEGGLIYSSQFLSFNVAGRQTYTIGPAWANANTDCICNTRPNYVNMATFRPVGSVLDIPMTILYSADEWAAIRLKSVASTVATYIYIDSQQPTANIYLYPIPGGGSVTLTAPQDQFSDITPNTALTFAPGLAKLARYQFAISFAAEFGAPVAPQIAAEYASLKSAIKYNNIKTQRVAYSSESQGVAGGAGTYDVLTDEIR